MVEVISFIASGAFRAMFDGVLGYFQRRQDHQYEIERLEKQWQIEVQRADIAARAAEAQAKHELDRLATEYRGRAELADIETLTTAMAATSRPSGIAWVDALNGSVRPVVTYTLLAFYVAYRMRSGQPYDPNTDGALLGSVLGFWFADRALRKMFGRT